MIQLKFWSGALHTLKMRCNYCHARILKSSLTQSEFFLRRLIINKSNGELFIRCHECNKPAKANAELVKSLKSAVLLIADLEK